MSPASIAWVAVLRSTRSGMGLRFGSIQAVQPPTYRSISEAQVSLGRKTGWPLPGSAWPVPERQRIRGRTEQSEKGASGTVVSSPGVKQGAAHPYNRGHAREEHSREPSSGPRCAYRGRGVGRRAQKQRFPDSVFLDSCLGRRPKQWRLACWCFNANAESGRIHFQGRGRWRVDREPNQ